MIFLSLIRLIWEARRTSGQVVQKKGKCHTLVIWINNSHLLKKKEKVTMVEFILEQLLTRQVSLAEWPTVSFVKSFTSLLFCNLDKGYCIHSFRPKISIAENAPLSKATHHHGKGWQAFPSTGRGTPPIKLVNILVP